MGGNGGGKDPKEPKSQPTPREPEEIRNPFGQMLQDMKTMKKGEKDLQEEHRNYEKLKYYAASQHEQDATNEAITAIQQLAIDRKPNLMHEAAVDTANDDLLDAVDHRKIQEHLGQHKHGFT